jgi:hypothetical protein
VGGWTPTFLVVCDLGEKEDWPLLFGFLDLSAIRG